MTSEESAPAHLAALDIRKKFGGTEVLKGITLSVQRGEVAAIIGPSGSGKSTFLRCLNHLVPPDSGRVLINGHEFGHLTGSGRRLNRPTKAAIRSQRARMPMVFQKFNLFSHKTALQNVMEGQISVLGRGKADAEARARELLASVGLSHRLNSYPVSLSGGEQQRVAIARALAMEPEMILFDEPTSSLDPELVNEVLKLIRQLAEPRNLSMIIVTHEMQFARNTADTIHFFDDGKCVASGTPDEILVNPKDERVERFISSVHT